MNECILIFTSLLTGYIMGIASLAIGSGLTSRAMRGKGLFPEVFESKGDVFTVETPDDMAPFPDVKNKDEEHILKKTNDFLLNFGTDKAEVENERT